MPSIDTERRRQKQERIEALLREFRGQRPTWAQLPPWISEQFIEGGLGQQQRTLFETTGKDAQS